MGFSLSHNNELKSLVRGRAGADTPMSIQDFDMPMSNRDFDVSMAIQDFDVLMQIKVLTRQCQFGTMKESFAKSPLIK